MGEPVFLRDEAAIAKGTPTLLQTSTQTLTWDLLPRLLPRLVGTAPTLRHERLRTAAETKRHAEADNKILGRLDIYNVVHRRKIGTYSQQLLSKQVNMGTKGGVTANCLDIGLFM